MIVRITLQRKGNAFLAPKYDVLITIFEPNFNLSCAKAICGIDNDSGSSTSQIDDVKYIVVFSTWIYGSGDTVLLLVELNVVFSLIL